MNEFKDMPTITPGVYEHYKGKRYRVLNIGRHTEIDEYFVVYTPLYEHAGQPDIWLRPYAMFMETVERNGVEVARFKKISDE
jgi:hypothetical protein